MVKQVFASAGPVPAASPGAATLVRRRRATAGLALLIAGVAAATIVTVWAIERAGYIPCELCLAERNPFYLGLPVAVAVAWAARRDWPRAAAIGFAFLAVVFGLSAALAGYHAGVEWSLWAGPSGCSGPLPQATSVNDFMAALKATRPVRCDAPALMVFGLSLAAWNVVVSLLLAALAALGAARSWAGRAAAAR